MKSWLARTSKPMPRPGQFAYLHYRTWSDPVSVTDRVFLVDHANPTMLHAWGTVKRVDVTERIPVGDDEEANSPPYSTYADVHVTVVCRSLLVLPLGLADFLTREDFGGFSDGYWLEEEGLVTALPVELGGKISQALGIDEPGPPVFLSYAREDASTAMRLYEMLSAAGVVVWLDRIALIPGQVWKQEVARAIQKSRAFIALLSENSVNKRGYVQKELRLGLEILSETPPSTVYLIPVRVEPCTPSHPLLQDLQWLDLFPDFDAACVRLLKAIRSIHGRRPSGIE